MIELKLLNDDITIDKGEGYYNLLLEQWKSANDMAMGISERRAHTNNLFITLNAALVTGIITVASSEIILRWIGLLIIPSGCLFGIFICKIWDQMISSYKNLNKVKYDIINELENHLPARILSYEWGKIDLNPEYKQFTLMEQRISQVFRLGYIAVLIFACLIFIAVLIFACLIFIGNNSQIIDMVKEYIREYINV